MYLLRAPLAILIWGRVAYIREASFVLHASSCKLWLGVKLSSVSDIGWSHVFPCTLMFVLPYDLISDGAPSPCSENCLDCAPVDGGYPGKFAGHMLVGGDQHGLSGANGVWIGLNEAYALCEVDSPREVVVFLARAIVSFTSIS